MKSGWVDAPDPGQHPAHRVAHDEAQMVDAEMVLHQIVLGRHHVVVVVFRERRPQAVGRLAAAAGSDRVGDDDEVLRGVERLTRPVQRAGEALGEHALRAAGRAMQHQHRLARGVADRRVAHLHLRHDLAGVEGEVFDHVLAGLRLGKIRRRHGERDGDHRRRNECTARHSPHPHVSLHEGLFRIDRPFLVRHR